MSRVACRRTKPPLNSPITGLVIALGAISRSSVTAKSPRLFSGLCVDIAELWTGIDHLMHRWTSASVDTRTRGELKAEVLLPVFNRETRLIIRDRALL
jgi:hypothetical protein